MAGTLSACPREEFVLGDAEATEVRRSPAARFLSGLARVSGLLKGALALHVSALAFALLHPISTPSLVVLLSGLAVTLLVLGAPWLAASPPQVAAASVSLSRSPSAHPTHGLSPEEKGSGALPSPLPFMGDRILLAEGTAAGLAQAAARLSQLSTPRAHPWGELMARVSHELRTPLNAVIGFSDVMQSELLGPVGHPRYREYARHIGECGRDLLKSAEDTLAITCLLDHDPGSEVTAVDLGTLVDEAWAFHCGPSSTHGLTLEADIPEGLEVLIAQRPLRQILINLLAEAVRRADARGTVGVVATHDGGLAQIEVYLRGQPGAPSVGQASLPICLARALLELAGASLIEVDDPHSTWRVVTALKCAPCGDAFVRMPDAALLHRTDAPCQVACA